MIALTVSVCGTGAFRPVTASGADACAAAPRQDRAPSCRFLHLNASVVLDEANNSMEAMVRVSLVTDAETSTIYTVLNPAMDVSGIKDESFGPLSFRRMYAGVINVSLGRNVPGGAGLNLTMAYGGTVATPSAQGGYWDYVGPEGGWVRPYGQYFPYDEQRDRTTSRLSITVPGDEVAVGPGFAVGNISDPVNGTVSYIWESAQPISGLSFVSGHLVHTTVVVGPTPYHVYFRPEHSAAASDYGTELARIGAFYGSLLGPAGYRNLTIVELDDKFAAWGQTVPTMIWLATRNFGGPFPYRLLAHELGHQWWGVDVEGREHSDNWVQEGFAGYCEAMYEMAVYGSRGYLDYCKIQYFNQFVQSPGTEPALADNDYDLAATKGPWVLHMLRYIIGDLAFNRTLYEFHRDFYGRRADPNDFSAEALSSTKMDLGAFFDFWLNTSGRLDYALNDPAMFQGPGALRRLQMGLENRDGPAGVPVDMGFYDEAGIPIALFPKAWNASTHNITVHHDIDYAVDTVKLDPDAWLLDVHPSNNEAPTRPAHLDFWALVLRASPPDPWENERFVLTADLASASSEGPLDVGVELLADGRPAGNLTVTLPASGPASVAMNLTLAAGAHLLAVLLDPRGDYLETDTANNAASLNITVRQRPPPAPDVRVLPGGLGLSPAGAAGGDAATLYARVENLGQADALNVTVRFWMDSLDAGYVGRSGELSIPAGEVALAAVPWQAVQGMHEVLARAELASGDDGDAGNNEASALIYVRVRPTAILSASLYEAGTGDWVELDGAASAAEGNVGHYLFDFGDGETGGWLADAASWHRYGSPGSYRARLKVMDDTGRESEWSAPVTIKVLAAPPVAVLSVRPRTGDVLTSFRFFSLSYGNDGSALEATWSFGDGRGARGNETGHAYAAWGDYTVSLTVRDDAGRTSVATEVIRVRDLPPMPAISLDKRSAVVGERIEFSARGSSDPDDPLPALSFMWDFGDGQKAQGVDASYAFRGPGTHRVVLTASDGNQTAESAVTVVVRSAPPAPVPERSSWLPWAVLAALLAAMGLLVASMMIPDDRRRGREEEE